jgi:hypothetical protein
MRLYHGTTLNKLREAKKTGALNPVNHNWIVSEDGTTYFWSEKFLKKEYGADHDIEPMGIQYALESADFALANETQNLKRIVLVFDSADLKKIGSLEVDDSCRNMEHCLKFSGAIPLSLVKKVYVDKEDLGLLRVYFVGLVASRADDCGLPIYADDAGMTYCEGCEQ